MKYSELKNQRVDLKKSIPLERPFTILFEPAAVCNFRCSFCYYKNPEFLNMKRGLMEFDDFRKIADDLKAWGEIKVVRLIGFGEPLINKRTPDMVKYLKENDIAERVEITTNGSLLTDETNQRLIDSGLDYIRISVYDQDIRSQVRSLFMMRGRNDKPFIYVKNLETENYDNQFVVKYCMISDEVAIEQKHNWLGGTSLRQVCPQPFKMLSVRYDGTVICCDPDWKGNTKIGNALRENIKDIWHGEKLRAFQQLQLEGRRFENESCKNCTFLNDDYVLDNMD